MHAGTIGLGVQAATPLSPHFALRGGVSLLPFSYNYDYDGVSRDDETYFTVPIEAKIDYFNGQILADYYPWRNRRFHLTAGFIFGSNRLFTVSGESPFEIQIGDVWIQPDKLGRVAAWIQTNAVKPYLGLGFGRSIPRTRIGFMFEVGAMYQGNPKIASSSNLIDSEVIENKESLSDMNQFIKDFTIYPMLNFRLSYRIF